MYGKIICRLPELLARAAAGDITAIILLAIAGISVGKEYYDCRKK